MDGIVSEAGVAEPVLSCAGMASARNLFAPVAPAFFSGRTLPDCLGRIGSLELRLARSARDLRQVQALRHQVFFCERLRPDFISPYQGHDRDAFDAVSDHLMVIDTDTRDCAVAGTYRLLRQDVADAASGFYSESEFIVQPLLERHRHLRFLELSRSCVLPAYRHRKTIELLWHGLWQYVQHHRIGAMIGCASFDGRDARNITQPLSFLQHAACAEQDWQVHAQAGRRAPIERLEQGAVDARAALRQMPPLIKGYLRAGARFSCDVVIDPVFQTTDIFTVMPVADIDAKYIDYFSAAANRFTA